MHILPVAVARSSFGVCVIRYISPFFHPYTLWERDFTSAALFQYAYNLTPLLRGGGCVLSSMMADAGAKTRRVLCGRGAEVEYAVHHFLVFTVIRR